MYNDDNDRSSYEYHYRYRPDYSEPIPMLEPVEPKKPKKTGRRIVAGVLCAALLLGMSFGAGWLVQDWRSGQKDETQIQMVDRGVAEVKTVNITGSQKLTFPEIYSANVNSCVSINVTASVGYNFFGQAVQNASSGSGFIITKDGYIVTNYHVIEGGENVSVTLNDGKSYPAQIIGGDKDYDIAVIKVDPGDTELKPVTLGTSSSLQVGDDVVTIGNPLGELTFSMSEGIVSCLNREINLDGTPFNMIQVSVAVNSGNSGGPLFNSYGEVVGIVSAKYSSDSRSSAASIEGLGFAIPLDDVLAMIQDIMTNGQVTSHAYMGISVANAANYPESGVRSGGYLTEVVSGGPADKAGLQAGDVITMVGTTTITTNSDITSILGSKSYKAGDTATITYVRGGQVHTTDITFGSTTEKPVEYDSQNQQNQQSEQNNQQPGSGNSDYYYGDMDEFFDQFFNGYGFGGRGAA
ncbi:MAG: S1C family serine protease [Oscillospiraceae bacterium]|nr:S1C family serine protease [Oscillospiraceae bacterium]